MDAALLGLIGVIVGAVLTTSIGSWLNHKRWIRERRLEAYTSYLSILADLQTRGGLSQQHEEPLVDRLNEANALMLILASKRVREAVRDLAGAVLASRDRSGSTAEPDFFGFQATVTRLARKDVFGWRTLR